MTSIPASHPTAVGVHDELMELTIRLVDEFPDFPAGSVMRCVARAARRALSAGVPGHQVSTQTERTARLALTTRLTGVPEQRTPAPQSVRRAG
ncbi:hypothetical protein [Nocardioides sp.]|uniref:hypothetical protein n=1 Tax=Nocardioides sp. TaxID=35761 RepID=UPI003D0C8381